MKFIKKIFCEMFATLTHAVKMLQVKSVGNHRIGQHLPTIKNPKK
jgi:hypothetical protein